MSVGSPFFSLVLCIAWLGQSVVPPAGVSARQQSRPARQQSPSGLVPGPRGFHPEDFYKPPHTCAPRDALVGVIVTNTSTDGLVNVRRGNGMVLRCDGFLLLPGALMEGTRTGKSEYADKQKVHIVLQPGQKEETTVEWRRPRMLEFPEGAPYVVLQLPGAHLPAARTLLPDTLKPGDEAQVWCARWDKAAGRFRSPERLSAKLGPPQDAKAEEKTPGHLLFETPVDGVPAGAIVAAPEEMAIGLVPGATELARRERFTSFAVLNRVTDRVAPVPTPDSAFGKQEAEGMVEVPGGPLLRGSPPGSSDWPRVIDGIACVAPFRIDQYEVTNAQYLAFWQTLPAGTMAELHFRAVCYPLGWAPEGPPFPPELADAPVLGVSATGATTYARRVGKRLPTLDEWVLAALGPAGDTAVPRWFREFAQDKRRISERLLAVHQAYLRAHPELGPGLQAIPWVWYGEDQLYAMEWSRQVTLQETGDLWSKWVDPLYIVPVGTRSFDVSPYKMRDALLNADEMVVSLAGQGEQFASVVWVLDHVDQTGPPLWSGVWGLEPSLGNSGPLSRLQRRAAFSAPLDRLLAAMNLVEASALLGFEDHLRVMAYPGRQTWVPWDTTAGATPAIVPGKPGAGQHVSYWVGPPPPPCCSSPSWRRYRPACVPG